MNFCHIGQYFPIRQGCQSFYLRLNNSVSNVTGYGLDSWASIPSIGRFVFRPKWGRRLNPQPSTVFVSTAFHQDLITCYMKLVTYLKR
jgi:hypothetical protein